jgi:hypothetical protein
VLKTQELLAAYEAAKPKREPLTFDDVERIWEEEVRPKLPEFEMMKRVWGVQQAPAETSRWRANWRVPEWGKGLRSTGTGRPRCHRGRCFLQE